MLGFHPFSSFRIDRQTLPDGYTFGWNSGGTNLPATDKGLVDQLTGSEADWQTCAPHTWAALMGSLHGDETCELSMVDASAGGLQRTFREREDHLVHALSPERLYGEQST